jgi:hypothetical protein
VRFAEFTICRRKNRHKLKTKDSNGHRNQARKLPANYALPEPAELLDEAFSAPSYLQTRKNNA